MKILQICNRIPYPPHDGGAVAMYNMTRGLRKAGCDVHLFTLNTHKHYFDPAAVPESLIAQEKFTTINADTRVKALGAFFNLFTRRSYNISRFEHQHVDRALQDLLSGNNFDIIQLEGVFMAPYLPAIRKYSRAPVILRAHNVEYRIWERMAEAASAGPKKLYLQLLAHRLKKYEQKVFREFDAIAAITPTDAELIKPYAEHKPVIDLPAGVEIFEGGKVKTCAAASSVFHLGALDWMPNLEGIMWFVENVWPEVIKKQENARFYIAGRHIPERVYRIASENVIVEGEVEDARKFMAEKGIMVVPLLSGSGMRIKIIEGMAQGKTIISTTVGAEGIRYRDGENILIADYPADFAKKILQCMNDAALCRKLGENACKLTELHYTNEAVAGKLKVFYKKLLDT